MVWCLGFRVYGFSFLGLSVVPTTVLSIKQGLADMFWNAAVFLCTVLGAVGS